MLNKGEIGVLRLRVAWSVCQSVRTSSTRLSFRRII